ncbi:MAG: PQQ-like beta-propeller repeat protein [Armatimonadetes bacterium]|nr:PQQ-like beta-propeller repeat protein [Armatimonadota bacterium]
MRPIGHILGTPGVRPRTAASASPIDTLGAAAAVSRVAGLVDPRSAVKVWEIASRGCPSQVLVAPNGNLLEKNIKRSVRLLTPQGQEIRTVALGKSVWGPQPAFCEDGGFVVTSETGVERYGPDGERKWALDLPEAPNATCAVGPEGNVYCYGRHKLYAIKDGKPLWEAAAEPHDWVSVPAVGADGTVVCGKLTAFSSDGTLQWRVEAEPVRGGVAVGPEGNVYYCGEDYQLHALGPGGKELWTHRLSGDKTHYATPIVDAEGRVYALGGSFGTHLSILSPEGALLRERTLDDGESLTVLPGGKLVLASGKHGMRVLDEEGKLAWRQPEGWLIGQPRQGLDGSIYLPQMEKLICWIGGGEFNRRQHEAALGRAAEPTESAPRIARFSSWVMVGGITLPVRA